ncbi:hypothetical protein [Flaviaesturariibacter amylovorans]|uniref:Acetyltransferase n=1 Tax=Flaviaesturariibacter amylovorans TaxID=1084520 RepID=A0ABP8GQ29_9BACT
MQQEKFDLWCVVELFGHSKIAGRCTEQNVAGTNMLRVDVPETATQPPFTRLLGSSAIYAINPVDEVTARAYAERLQSKPIESWDVKSMLEKNTQMRLSLGMGAEVPVGRDTDDFDNDF